MVEARGDIQDGHISSRLLYQFLRTPNSLDSDTMDFINAHLDGCEQCQQDVSAIHQLSEIDIVGDDRAPEIAPETFSFWRVLFRRRMLPAYAVLAAVVLVVVVLVSLSDETSPLLIARALTQSEAQRSGYTIVALAGGVTTRGGDVSEASAPVIVRGAEPQPVVLSLEAVTFEDEDMTYSVTITAADGSVMWQSALSVEQVESGRVWLMLDPEDIRPGVYQVSVVEHQRDYQAIVSTARFQITE